MASLDQEDQAIGYVWLRRIHWLSIDAEGWDPLILEGARELLRTQRVDLLEFEYHSKGLWAAALPAGERRDLKSALTQLHEFGYSCLWQGDKGGLAEASGSSWCDEYEIRSHSNLVCSWREDLKSVLRTLDCTSQAADTVRRGCGGGGRGKH